MKYSYGIPGYVIWVTHILMGALLGYVGYQITYNKPINSNWGLFLLVTGALMAFYHAHLWYLKG